MLMYFLIPHRCVILFFFFFFNDTATTEIYTLSLHDALPITKPPEPPDPAEPPYRNRCITSDWTPLAASRESGLSGRSRLHDRADLAHGLAGQTQLREIPYLRTEVAPEHRRGQRDEAVDDRRYHADGPSQLRHGNEPARHVLDHILVL